MANRNASISQILYDAATENNVPVLRNLLTHDPFLLLRSPLSACTTFPLHIACKYGHLEFVSELLNHNPRLSEDLDSNKSSPLHIASQNGHLELIRPLVLAMPNMCFSRDTLGMTPIHVAAMKGYLPVLEELLSLVPVAAKERVGPVVGSIGGDTILHLCVRLNKLDALKTLVRKVGDAEFLNARNGDGETILHLAVDNKQLEMVKEMLKDGRMKVNIHNANGLTAMDILGKNLKGPDRETNERLKQALDEAEGLTLLHQIRSSIHIPTWFEGKSNEILVAASFMAAIAFNAGINPPSGVWQDTQVSNSTAVTAANNVTQTTHTTGMPILAQMSMPAYESFLRDTSMCLVLSTFAMAALIMPGRDAVVLSLGMVMSAVIYMCSAYRTAIHALKYVELGLDLSRSLFKDFMALSFLLLLPRFDLCLEYLDHEIRRKWCLRVRRCSGWVIELKKGLFRN